MLADLGSIYKWNPGVSHSTSEEPGGEGATRHCDLQSPKGKKLGYLEESAHAWREGEGFKINIDDTNLPLKTNAVTFALESDGDQTIVRVSPEYELKFGPLGKLLDALGGRRRFEKGMQGMVAGLKHHVETGEEIGTAVPGSEAR